MEQARAEQLPPEGDWRTWYLQGGRGSGKTRTGAETLAGWTQYFTEGPGDWAIVAPTYADARNTCVEGPSGVLQALGALVEPGGWLSSLGQIKLRNGSTIFLDGADDGAERIQGKNLRGAWCDEVGLWKKWETAWNVSLAYAVRFEPGLIVATGTPKIGHGLVRQLIEDDRVPVTRMRMVDNLPNLNKHAVDQLLEMYGGTRMGAQELEGEWFSDLEGDLLLRSWWRYYPPRRNEETDVQFVSRLPKFDMVVCSWDTPLKDKEASDYVAGQCWGISAGLRYLLDTRVDRMNYSAAKRSALEMYEWATGMWPASAHYVLVENAGYGVELIEDLKRTIPGVQKVKPGAEGSKGMRAFAASPDLESGNCLLPGFPMDDGTGPDEIRSPAHTVALVNECSMFRIDGTHSSHDDQVDAWSQTMNWLRSRGKRKAGMWVPEGIV